MNATRAIASCEAPAGLSMLSQTSKIPAVNVGTAKKSTVPNSLRVSMRASATPTAMPGRAIGRAMEKKLRAGPRPRVRLASNRQKHCSVKAALASR